MIARSRKATIAAAFGRAAASYDAHAEVQRKAAESLAGRIAGLGLPPEPCLLEIGCGTGLLTGALHRALPHAHGLISDLSPIMVRQCRARHPAPGYLYCAMDGEAPCVAGPRFDLICASLAVQWFDDLPRSLGVLHGLLRPGGWLAFATLGPATLSEWRDAHVAERLPPPTPDFPEPATIAAAWPGIVAPGAIEQAVVRERYSDGRAFLASLRAIGAGTKRPGGLPLRPEQLGRVLARFERDHASTASYEVLYAAFRR